ncbi:MAG TPA: hypothetical protein VFT56_16430 [Sphingomonas sp.]|nr:hypothetical protein [Sphingomonas sp.]
MNRLLAMDLGAERALLSALRALPVTLEFLDRPKQKMTVPELRAIVADAPGAAEAFVLAIGAGQRRLVAKANWRREVTLPLLQVFGLITGAAQRFRKESGGAILVILPSEAALPSGASSSRSVLLRAVLGMTEALRAELGNAPVRVSIAFHDPADDNVAELVDRLARVLASGQMYSLARDLTAERIDAYFQPMLRALDRTGAGPPLPDIGPMAAVYDLERVGAARD